jgi:GNAT superfamily N-acetyltransferase
MHKKHNITIREATISEDTLIAQHFYQLWLDNKITPNSIRSDWLEETRKFITQARQNLAFQAFVAVISDRVIGSTSCQLFAGLYPTPFKSDFRKYGYLWNVYVEANYRRQGIATKLTKTAIDYLNSLNCSHAILHASPQGKPLYESLGFVPKNEMVLQLKKRS